MLGETAELIVALKLRDQMSGPLRGISGAIDNLARNASVRGGLSQISQGIGVGLRNSAIIGGVAIAGLTTQIRAGVESLRELENVEAQTAAALASTGGVSGQTADSIRRLSEEYETLGGVLDDKIIQAGANVLLTFRRIDQDAFEPALEAALNLSTALGTDLQTAVLQVGKALEDPVSGVTALRRAGVQLTDQQQDQIKALVESNRLYEAQQLILAELEVQVGGRFAAAGRTNEASVARMGDAWEDLQQSLARGLLPGIDKVATRLSTIFADPAVIQRIEDFGSRLAGFLNEENLDRAEEAVRGVFGYLASIPWGAIGDGLRIAGQGAKVALDAFRSLPPGVQNALITLLAANKLTGGLVASGLGQLAAVALGSLKTITAGHVTVVGPVSGVPGTGGGLLGGLGRGLATGAAVAGGAALAGVAAVEVINFEDMRDKAQGGLQATLDGMRRESLADTTRSIAAIQAQIDQERPLLDGILFNTNIRPQLEQELSELRKIQGWQQAFAAIQERTAADAKSADTAARTSAAFQTSEMARTRAATVERLTTLAGKYDAQNAQLSGANRALNSINAKTPPTHPVTVNNSITIPVSISATLIEQRLVTARLASVGIPTAPTLL
jgi:hypothetical protein